jgi:hypothetical protein
MLKNLKKKIYQLERINLFYEKINECDIEFNVIILKLIEKKLYNDIKNENLEEKSLFKFLLHPQLFKKNLYDETNYILWKDINMSSKLNLLIEMIKNFKIQNKKIIISSSYSSSFYFISSFLIKLNFFIV